MKVPRTINTFCSRCGVHTKHMVTLYKTGKRRALAKGEQRHEEKKKGYGGQKFPLQRKFAKTTKKQTLTLKCPVCGFIRHKEGIRLRKLSIE